MTASSSNSNGDNPSTQRAIRLSDQENQQYVALDAPLTTGKPWDLEINSAYLRRWAWSGAIFILAIHIFLAVVVAIGDTGTTVTLIDQWGYFLVGLVFASAFYLAFARPRVRANEDGVEVRNFVGTRFYPWSVIYGLNFPQGSKFARLELPEFEYVPLWAIQAGDGARSISAIEDFRILESQFMPED